MKIFLIAALSLSLIRTVAAQPSMSKPRTVAERLGYPADSRLLIIHAQDLGMAHSIDKASFEALEKGWVTSGSIMVPCPWFPEVVRWVKNHPNADLGVRLDMNATYPSYRWGPVSEQKPGSGLLDMDGYLPLLPPYVAHHATQAEVEAEGKAQIDKALKSGIPISHLDNYAKTLILTPELFQVYWKLKQQYRLPIVFPSRQIVQRGRANSDRKTYSYGGISLDLNQFPVDSVTEIFAGYTKKDWLGVYEKALAALPPGVYQLSVHLGYDNDELQAITGGDPNWGSQWRQNDLDVVSSPDFQKFLKDSHFVLVSWKDLQKVLPKE